jgi:hypothetical protein
MLCSGTAGESSAAVRTRVLAARERQRARLTGDGLRVNAELTPALVARDCRLDTVSQRTLGAAARRLGLTARGYERTRRVARTIADLDGADAIAAEHVAEFYSFARCDHGFGGAITALTHTFSSLRLLFASAILVLGPKSYVCYSFTVFTAIAQADLLTNSRDLWAEDDVAAPIHGDDHGLLSLEESAGHL